MGGMVREVLFVPFDHWGTRTRTRPIVLVRTILYFLNFCGGKSRYVARLITT